MMRRWVTAMLAPVSVMVPVAVALSAQDSPPPERRGEVHLPLSDYLSLVEGARLVERAASERAENEQPAVAELVEQSATIVWPQTDAPLVADVTTRLEVLLDGGRAEPVRLPFTGLAWRVEVEPVAGTSIRRTPAGFDLIAADVGRYRVTVWSRERIVDAAGTQRLEVAPLHAPVGAFEVDVPAASVLHVTGAVIDAETETNGRRLVRLASARGHGATLLVSRDVEGSDGDELVADVDVATVVELGVDGLRRHDVLLYRVSRGSLSRFELTVPNGLTPTRIVTDEGRPKVTLDSGVLRIERDEKLAAGLGFVVLTSPLVHANRLSLPPIEPAAPPRARFVLLSSELAADLEPIPRSDFPRVDVSDLPDGLAATAPAPIHKAWRDTRGARTVTARLTTRPREPTLESVVLERRSLSLLTVQGTLVQRDTFVLRTTAATFAHRLSAGSTLWSARVNDAWVRATVKDGSVRVPVGLGGGDREVIEIVSVSRRPVPERKSRFEIDLGAASAPVLRHRWSVLLPEDYEYRFASGELRPVSVRRPPRSPSKRFASGALRGGSSSMAGPGGHAGLRARVVDAQELVLPGATVIVSNRDIGWTLTGTTDEHGEVRFGALPRGSYSVTAELSGFSPWRLEELGLAPGDQPIYEISLDVASVAETVTVTGEAPLIDTRSSGTTYTFGAGRGPRRASPRKRKAEVNTLPEYRYQASTLRAGLATGVKPIPVLIPETGKLIELEAALPPRIVRASFDVKPK